MMGSKRTDRLGSLLKEVISDVILKNVKNPLVPDLITITSVDITKDLRQAKVYVSVIGVQEIKDKAIQALQSAAGFIAVHASKQVVMRFFPELTFIIDDSVEKQAKINDVIHKIQKERKQRLPDEE